MVEIFQNIRQLYTFAQPCEELIAHVEFFSESEAEQTWLHAGTQPFSVKMFASWTPTFYINLGSPYQISLGNQHFNIAAKQDILLLRDSIVKRLNSPTDNIFTVKFHPGGLETVLGINQNKCVNKLIPLQQIIPQALLNAIRQPITFQERTNLMQDYLLSQFEKSTSPDHYLSLVNRSIGEYTKSGLQLSTDLVAEKVFLTSKTINRYFHRSIGLSPKRYFCNLRARTALTAYVSNTKAFVPENFGYYDQSHFAKDIHHFTGQKLSRQLL